MRRNKPDRGYGWDDPWDRAPAGHTIEHTREPVPEESPDAPPPYRYEPPRKRRHHVIPFLLAAVAVFAGGVLVGRSLLTNMVYSTVLQEFGDDDDGNDQEDDGTGADGGIYDDTPDADTTDADEEEDTAACYLESFPFGGDARITQVTEEGLPELSYEEIYEKSIDSIVSLTCDLIDGSYCTGTGIVFSEDGYIVTNEHVIDGALTCSVTLQNDQSYDAQIVGLDEETDLAVLKIDAEGLTPAEFGVSDEIVVGNGCVAIGNPLGESFRGTMTTGIISAMNRDVSVNGHYMTLIQTDAAINSGNSGGPLINLYGQVIGICNMKMMSSSTTVEGLGFAIPSATVENIVNKLVEGGEVIRAMLGITAYNLSVEECEDLGIDSGIMVVTVSEASDACKKGIQEGDVILAANGTLVTSVNQLNTMKADMSPGDTLNLTILRDGSTLHFTVVLQEKSEVY